jgi:H+/Cl- antiporter ClcA
MTLFDRLFPDRPPTELGDFTATRRLVPIAMLATVIGVVSGLAAYVLLKLIGLFTNLFFLHRASTEMVSPSQHHLGPWVIFVPIAGALVIGAMARWGSERIRGHGIPEALESILIRGSRVDRAVLLAQRARSS